MTFFTRLTIMAAALAAAANVNAQGRTDLLWLAGDAMSYGWSLDDATAIEATAANPKTYQGTVYLEGDKDFKFLTTYDFGNQEYHPVENGARPDADGKVTLMLDGDDNKIQVAESANYLITVDTESLEATIVKSAYQETHIPYASLFVVGSVLESGYAVDNGLALVQGVDKPYEFTAEGVELLAGSFKIANALKGAGTWQAKYWYFRNLDDATKMDLAAEGDNQWEITEAGKYNITVDIVANTIAIAPHVDAIDVPVADTVNGPATYFSIDGRRVANPSAGSLVIRVAADGTATKVLF